MPRQRTSNLQGDMLYTRRNRPAQTASLRRHNVASRAQFEEPQPPQLEAPPQFETPPPPMSFFEAISQEDEPPEVEEGGVEEEQSPSGANNPCPGAPIDGSILRGFNTHVAAMVWRNTDRDVLKCLCHTRKMLQWKFARNQSTRLWRNFFRHSTLSRLRDISYERPNRNLICAFVERWHPETNTFHMPFGEMTITLEDVYCITGLPLTGLPVAYDEYTDESAAELVERLLGVSSQEAEIALGGANGKMLKLGWLCDQFSGDVTSDDPDVAHCAARAYLLYILGCTLFGDKTGTKVNVCYLRLLEDASSVQEYAWGAATLAFLYRQLGSASRFRTSQMCGYLTLLEAWIYDHFPSTQPPHNLAHDGSVPLAQRWSQPTHPGGDIDIVRSYRERLDSLRATDVIWDPYSQLISDYHRPEVTFYIGCLRCFEVVEPYHPDRVLRQFGHVQTIPAAPLGPGQHRRGGSAQRQRARWHEAVRGYFETWDNHLLTDDRRGRLANPSWSCSPDYMDWYSRVSHPRVQNPVHHSGFAATSTATDTDYRDRVSTASDHLRPLLDRWRVRGEGDEDYQMLEAAFYALQGPFIGGGDTFGAGTSGGGGGETSRAGTSRGGGETSTRRSRRG